MYFDLYYKMLKDVHKKISNIDEPEDRDQYLGLDKQQIKKLKNLEKLEISLIQNYMKLLPLQA